MALEFCKKSGGNSARDSSFETAKSGLEMAFWRVESGERVVASTLSGLGDKCDSS